MYMGLFPSILYTISLQMAYCGISEKYQCDKNPDSHEKKKKMWQKSPPKQGRPKSVNSSNQKSKGKVHHFPLENPN